MHADGTASTSRARSRRRPRRDAIVAVVAELAPGWEICNEVELLDVAAAPDVEDVGRMTVRARRRGR